MLDVAASKSAELEALLDDKYTLHLARRVLQAAGAAPPPAEDAPEAADDEPEPMEVDGGASPSAEPTEALLALWREARAVAADEE